MPASRNIPHQRALIATVLVAAVLAAMSLGGCAAKKVADPLVPPKPAAPPPWQLKRPESAVTSYLLWVSYAYRIATSDVTTAVMGPDESVRVNSYVLRNSERDQIIDMHPTRVDFRSTTIEGRYATVATHERWDYRYISMKTEKYAGPALKATYDTTYTVHQDDDGLWRVYEVRPQAIGAVK